MVCSTIPARDRIAGRVNRHRNSNWGLTDANGYPWWPFGDHGRHTKLVV